MMLPFSSTRTGVVHPNAPIEAPILSTSLSSVVCIRYQLLDRPVLDPVGRPGRVGRVRGPGIDQCHYRPLCSVWIRQQPLLLH
jgi:hypothetical protein